jgi:hypothetical protein
MHAPVLIPGNTLFWQRRVMKDRAHGGFPGGAFVFPGSSMTLGMTRFPGRSPLARLTGLTGGLFQFPGVVEKSPAGE